MFDVKASVENTFLYDTLYVTQKIYIDNGRVVTKKRKKGCYIEKKKNKIVILQFFLKHQSAFIDYLRIEITVNSVP